MNGLVNIITLNSVALGVRRGEDEAFIFSLEMLRFGWANLPGELHPVVSIGPST